MPLQISVLAYHFLVCQLWFYYQKRYVKHILIPKRKSMADWTILNRSLFWPYVQILLVLKKHHPAQRGTIVTVWGRASNILQAAEENLQGSFYSSLVVFPGTPSRSVNQKVMLRAVVLTKLRYFCYKVVYSPPGMLEGCGEKPWN